MHTDAQRQHWRWILSVMPHIGLEIALSIFLCMQYAYGLTKCIYQHLDIATSICISLNITCPNVNSSLHCSIVFESQGGPILVIHCCFDMVRTFENRLLQCVQVGAYQSQDDPLGGCSWKEGILFFIQGFGAGRRKGTGQKSRDRRSR